MVQDNLDMREIANALSRVKSQLDVLSDQLVELGLVYESELVQKVEAADAVEYAEGLAETRHLLTDDAVDGPPEAFDGSPEPFGATLSGALAEALTPKSAG